MGNLDSNGEERMLVRGRRRDLKRKKEEEGGKTRSGRGPGLMREGKEK